MSTEFRRPSIRFALTALVAAIALDVGVHALMKKREADRWTLAITDPSMVAIRNLVARGNFSQATGKLNTTYRFDHESGLIALRQFSIIVLQRGLKERDLFEQCYAASALAAGGESDSL